jgi:hypothetical protein
MAELTPDRIIYPIPGQTQPIVLDAYQTWSSIAKSAFQLANQYAQGVANIPITPVNFTANFSPQLALSPFPTLPKPVVPADLSFTPPPVPSDIPTIDVPTLPDLTYVSGMLDSIGGVIDTLLGGNPMPPALARQLRDRAYSDAWAEEERAVDQAYAEFAARGFEEPPGLLNRRVAEARADARAKRQLMNRDVYIQEQMLAIENLRFAVTSGIQLESTRVRVFEAQANLEIEQVRLIEQTNQLKLDGWRAELQLFDARLRSEVEELDAATKVFEANVRVYTADAQVSMAAGEYDNRRFQLNLAQEQAIVDTEMKRADQNFEQMRYITSVMLEIKKTLATVSSQLASSAMSAVNIGASMSSSDSMSLGYSQGVSWSGSLEDDS